MPRVDWSSARLIQPVPHQLCHHPKPKFSGLYGSTNKLVIATVTPCEFADRDELNWCGHLGADTFSDP
jgi:hypothetical protein